MVVGTRSHPRSTVLVWWLGPMVLILAAAASDLHADEEADGRAVYAAACGECHDTGKAYAPMIGDASWAWRARAGIEVLMVKVRYGTPGMPAKGGCSACSDGELVAATRYILDNSPPN